MDKQQILEQIAVLFNDDGVCARDRLVAGQILLKEADNTNSGVEQRAEAAMAKILGTDVPDVTQIAAVEALEAVVEVGQEAKLNDFLALIPKEIAEATNLQKLAIDLRSRGWVDRKMQGYRYWKRQLDFSKRREPL